jgi:hypothetical protein
MQVRRNDFDVTNRIQTTDQSVVEREIARLFRLLYPGAEHALMDRAFADFAALYRGQYAGYQASDTRFHDVQNVMEVTLAMARLMDGYERSRRDSPPLGTRLFQLGILLALFHDIGYLRKTSDFTAPNGAFYTASHVSRGAQFLREYLPKVGLEDIKETVAELVHFTGAEKPIADIAVNDPLLRFLGNLLGSAEIMAQMADRCYLEKCRDRLYPEFVEAGLAGRQTEQTATGGEIVYKSGEDLVQQTPAFFEAAVNRLEDDLDGVYNYAATHFGGYNLYIHAATRNVHFAKEVSSGNLKLRRTIPNL